MLHALEPPGRLKFGLDAGLFLRGETILACTSLSNLRNPSIWIDLNDLDVCLTQKVVA